VCVCVCVCVCVSVLCRGALHVCGTVQPPVLFLMPWGDTVSQLSNDKDRKQTLKEWKTLLCNWWDPWRFRARAHLIGRSRVGGACARQLCRLAAALTNLMWIVFFIDVKGRGCTGKKKSPPTHALKQTRAHMETPKVIQMGESCRWHHNHRWHPTEPCLFVFPVFTTTGIHPTPSWSSEGDAMELEVGEDTNRHQSFCQRLSAASACL